jgi:hypothetical protein
MVAVTVPVKVGDAAVPVGVYVTVGVIIPAQIFEDAPVLSCALLQTNPAPVASTAIVSDPPPPDVTVPRLFQ